MSLDGFITIDSSIASSSSGLYVTGLPGVTIAQLDGLTRDEQADFEAFFENLYALSQVNLKIDVQRALAQRFHIDKKLVSRETSKFTTDILDGSELSGVKIEINLSKYARTHILNAQFYLDTEIVDVADCDIDWNNGTNLPNALAVGYGNGLFVIVGTNLIATSPDGINWTNRTAPNSNDWYSVTYGNGKFVAIANSGAGDMVMYSEDGETWTAVAASVNNSWLKVKWIEELGLFVAVSSNSGNLNEVMTSPNGVNWVTQTTAGNYDWEGLAYGNGVLVATTGAGYAMYSTDAITWTLVSGIGIDSESVAFGNDVFVARNDANEFIHSTDGITWTAGEYVPRFSATTPDWSQVIFNGVYFIAVGQGFAAVSTDGITWYETTAILAGGISSLANNNGVIVALSGTELANYGVPNSLMFDSVEVLIYDTDEDGDLLGTFTKTGLSEGVNALQINTSFDVDDLFVAFRAPSGLFRQSENKYFATDSLSTDNLSCLFPCSLGSEGSVTQINEGGLNVKFNVVCSLQKFIEENINLFQYALWYRIGVDLMKERRVSDRVTRWVVLSPERAVELMEIYNEDYKAALDSATMNIKMNEDPICFICKRPIKAVTSLP